MTTARPRRARISRVIAAIKRKLHLKDEIGLKIKDEDLGEFIAFNEEDGYGTWDQ